jgi:hypothetical protein
VIPIRNQKDTTIDVADVDGKTDAEVAIRVGSTVAKTLEECIETKLAEHFKVYWGDPDSVSIGNLQSDLESVLARVLDLEWEPLGRADFFSAAQKVVTLRHQQALTSDDVERATQSIAEVSLSREALRRVRSQKQSAAAKSVDQVMAGLDGSIMLAVSDFVTAIASASTSDPVANTDRQVELVRSGAVLRLKQGLRALVEAEVRRFF